MLLAVVALLGVAGWGYATWVDYRDTTARAVRDVVSIASTLSLQARRTFDIALAIADPVARYISEEGGAQPDWERSERLGLKRQVEMFPGLNALVVIDPDGKVVMGTDSGHLPGVNVADREYFRRHVAGDMVVIGPPVVSRSTGNTVITVSCRVEDPASGRFLGVVVVGVKVAYFEDFAEDLQRPNITLALVREDGVVLFRSPWNAVQRIEDPAGLRILAQVQSGALEVVSPIDGVRRIAAHERVDDTPVVAGAGIAKAAVLAPWYSRLLRSGAILLGSLVVLGLFGAFTLRGFARDEHRKQEIEAANQRLQGALVDRDILLQEVHHRVKNNLQIISSLLSMESMRAQPQARPGYEDSLRRIQAMGLVHDLLYRSQDFARVEMGTYLRRLAEAVAKQVEGVTISVEGDDLALHLDRAVPMAMLTAEIISNAVKHGFPGGKTGHVRVHLRQDGEEIVLTVADDGIGLPPDFDSRRQKSLGMTLIHNLTRQLDGRIEIIGNGGTTATLTVPR